MVSMAISSLVTFVLLHESLGAIHSGHFENHAQQTMSVGASGALMRNYREPYDDAKSPNASLQAGRKHQSSGSGATCAPLRSHGTYYSVDIKVGTPPQTFSVVADTGSDAIIIPSCVCQDHGSCSKKDRCFRGTNHSSTFVIKGLNSSTADKPTLPVINMFFGSGEIKAIVATDVVYVGGVGHLMNNSVMLMVDRALRISGPFEGILGLGPPKNTSDFKLLHKMEPSGEVQDATAAPTRAGSMSGVVTPAGAIRHPMGRSSAGEIESILREAMAKHGNMEDVVGDIAHHSPQALQQLSMESVDNRYWPFGIPKPGQGHKKHGFQPLGFDEATHTSAFSMCFADMEADGALHLGVPKSEHSMLSVGQEHWSLDMRGISVGNASMDAPVSFCAPSMKEEGAQTACGAIPDSGTTLFMAPAAHVEKLFGDICDNWNRCRTAVNQGLQNEKLKIFQMLLHECSAWVGKNGDKNTTLNELPDLHFRLAGKDGKLGSISLTGDDYIIETMEDEVEMVTRNIFGMSMKVPKKTGKVKRVCAPAFSSMEMHTHDNGHVWILGAPVFYKYTVSYENNPNAPAIAFSKQKCGCPHEKDALLSSDAMQHPNSGMREVHSAPRLPSFDVKFPFGL